MRAYNRILDLFGVITGILAHVIAFSVTIDVVLRVLNVGEIAWTLDVAEYALYFMTFLGAPWALREGAHVRIDLVVSVLPSRTALLAEKVANIIGFVASAILIYYGGKVTVASYVAGSMIYKELVFPEWWLLPIIPVSALLICIEFMIRMRRASANLPREIQQTEVY